MTDTFQPYPEYKDSGSCWLTTVPSHWAVHNLRTLIRHRNERNRPDLPLLSVAREKGVFVRSLTDENENHNVIPEDLRNYKVARAGNLVINKMKAWQGSMGIAPCDGIVSPAYFVYDFSIANRSFGQVLLRSKPYVAHFGQASDGVRVGQWDLTISGMRQLPVLVPPPSEQASIVRFLDHANGRIERAIRAKRKIITLLNEQKQAIIHRAVTRGLDPNVPLKPSGIPWLGVIPKHWKVQRLKHLASFQSGDGITSLQIEPHGDYPVFGGNGLRGYTPLYTHDGHFALIGRQGALCGNINYAKGKFFASEHAIVTTLRPDYSVLWFGEMLKVMNLNQYSQSAAQPGLSVERIKNLATPVPPATEQPKLVAAFQEQTEPINTAITNFEREIALLREYRIRLTADVVTGKLDVRAAAASLPAPEPVEHVHSVSPGATDAADTDPDLEEADE
jgi:type I restriction enzyme S subunit